MTRRLLNAEMVQVSQRVMWILVGWVLKGSERCDGQSRHRMLW